MSGAYLCHNKIPEDMHIPKVPHPEHGREDPWPDHPEPQKVPQWHPLSDETTVMIC